MTGEFESIYDKVIKYQIICECREPMHVGSGKEKGGILTRHTDGRPFLQATGIAGAFRDYFSQKKEMQAELFGGVTQDAGEDSRIRFSDGEFLNASVYTELRPRVKINGETGTCQSAAAKGSELVSGQKFEIESVAAGASLSFAVYIFEKEKEYGAVFEEALLALHLGRIQLGGQKSNGCGYLSLLSVKKSCYDMYQKKDRELWLKEEKTAEEIIGFLLCQENTDNERLCFEMSAETEGAVLVKTVSAAQYDEKESVTGNIQNHKREYILPASSIKGAVRNQMEKILRYKELDYRFIKEIFGAAAEREEKGIVGNIRFFDCVIGNAEDNDKVSAQKRIHIDKFTGGVIPSHLFSEKPAFGRINIRVELLNDRDKKENALLLLALRDLGLGIYPVGGGSNVGRGYLKGDRLKVRKGTEILAEIDFRTGKVTKGTEVIEEYLKALN